MIKLVIFDWNGTLIPDVQATVLAENYAYKRFGAKHITVKWFRKNCELPWTKHMKNCGLAEKQIKDNIQEIQDKFHERHEELIKKIRSRSGARKLLAFLEKNRVDKAIISNHRTESINKSLERLKLKQYFHHVLANNTTVGTINLSKDKRIKQYLKKHNYSPLETIIIGDSDEEIQIAKKIGLTSIAITHGIIDADRLKKEKPDYLVTSLDKIIPLIKKLNKKKQA